MELSLAAAGHQKVKSSAWYWYIYIYTSAFGTLTEETLFTVLSSIQAASRGSSISSAHPLTLLPLPPLSPAATATTRPSSRLSPCRTRHAPGSLTPSRWCPSRRWPRATTEAGGGVSLSPSTSHSARLVSSARKTVPPSGSPSESAS